eukprot:Nk52_evm26s250 gene=Nk52_evmTU26s250
MASRSSSRHFVMGIQQGLAVLVLVLVVACMGGKGFAQVHASRVDNSRSANGALYVCETATIDSDNVCLFTASTTAGFVASAHNINRGVGGTNARRPVNNANQALQTGVIPFTQGDTLAAATNVVGEDWNFCLAFEIMAPLRDLMMYDPTKISTQFDAAVKPLTDCHIKDSQKTVNGIVGYSLSEIKTIATAVKTNSVFNGQPTGTGQVHNQVLQFLEEGSLDLVCLMTTISNSMCDSIRAQWQLSAGQISDCWVAGYTALYGAPTSGLTTTSTTFCSTCTSNTPGAAPLAARPSFTTLVAGAFLTLGVGLFF